MGRERELAALVEALEQVESGQGQVVGIVAEAGGGKSRLLYEFRQRLAGKRVTYLAGPASPMGMPYHPILDLLRNRGAVLKGGLSAQAMATLWIEKAASNCSNAPALPTPVFVMVNPRCTAHASA